MFKISHRKITATMKLHLSTHFRVLVRTHSSRRVRQISLGRLRAGLTRVHFNLLHLKPGTYTLVIQALPHGKKPGKRG
jgi:hypothetical protein